MCYAPGGSSPSLSEEYCYSFIIYKIDSNKLKSLNKIKNTDKIKIINLAGNLAKKRN